MAKPDLRTTIYWKPDVVIGMERNSSLQFYAADTPTTYSVVIEGIGRKMVYVKKKGLFRVEK